MPRVRHNWGGRGEVDTNLMIGGGRRLAVSSGSEKKN